tara:strand:+ start:50 stop:187 length:138 start_codon:yes stop_codon:yes gene_type:complete
MKDYTKVISNLKQTIKKGGAEATISALKKTLIVVEKKNKEAIGIV